MGKFCQVYIELWPLIYVKILFPGSLLSIEMWRRCSRVILHLSHTLSASAIFALEMWRRCSRVILHLSIYRPIFFKLCIGVYIKKEWSGI